MESPEAMKRAESKANAVEVLILAAKHHDKLVRASTSDRMYDQLGRGTHTATQEEWACMISW